VAYVVRQFKSLGSMLFCVLTWYRVGPFMFRGSRFYHSAHNCSNMRFQYFATFLDCTNILLPIFMFSIYFILLC
jgi:hypothetical protein